MKVLTYKPASNCLALLDYTEKTIHTSHGKMYRATTKTGHSIIITDDHSLATVGSATDFFAPVSPVDALGCYVPIPYSGIPDDSGTEEDTVYDSTNMLTWGGGELRDIFEAAKEITFLEDKEKAETQFMLMKAGLPYRMTNDKIIIDFSVDCIPEGNKLVPREEADPTNMYRILPFLWSEVISVEEVERTEYTYDFTVPEFPLFIGNFILVYDTMQLHVPATEGARQDALEKMLPSKNLFSGRDLEPMMLPQQEHLFGAYLAAKPSKAKSVDVKDANQARDLIERAVVKPDNPCTFKGMHTTVGLVWINDCMPENLRNYSASWNKGTLRSMLSKLGKEKPELYTQAADHIKEVGSQFAYLMGSSFKAEDFDLDKLKKHRDIVFDKVEDTLRGIDASSGSKTEKYNKKVKVLRDAQEFSQNLTSKETENNFQQWAYSGARGSKSQVMQIISAPTVVADPRDRVIPMLIRHSYNEGLTPTDYWVSSYGTRKGTVGAKLSVAPGGMMAKELIANTLDIVVSEHNCGTQEGIPMKITDTKDVLERYEAGTNRLVDASYLEQLKREGKETIIVRSPSTCHSRHGVCQLCYGHNEKGQLPEIGDNVGVQAGQSVSEPLTQMGLSSKHTAGTAAEEKVGLSTIKQFFSMSNQYEGAAIIAQADGIVSSITPSPTGGTTLVVGKKKYHVAPGRGIKVSVGEQVKAGDILTGGLPNLAKIVPHKGIDFSRGLFIAHAADLYSRAGVPTVKKNFEVMARAMVNYVEIEDPGDFPYIPGDVVDYNELRSRIEEAKRLHPSDKLPKYKPIQKGSTWAPQFKDDWLGNLGFKYLKTNLVNNAVMGSTSKVHGYNPVAAYATGSEFGESTGGRY